MSRSTPNPDDPLAHVQDTSCLGRFIVQKRLRGFPWQLHAHTDDGHAGIQSLETWVQKGYDARLLDQARRAPDGGLHVVAELLTNKTLCVNLATGQERAIAIPPAAAVRYCHRIDHPHVTAAAVEKVIETELQFNCGDWSAYKADLTPDQVRASLVKRLDAPMTQSEETNHGTHGTGTEQPEEDPE
jgi:hypothetical protein